MIVKLAALRYLVGEGIEKRTVVNWSVRNWENNEIVIKSRLEHTYGMRGLLEHLLFPFLLLLLSISMPILGAVVIYRTNSRRRRDKIQCGQIKHIEHREYLPQK